VAWVDGHATELDKTSISREFLFLIPVYVPNHKEKSAPIVSIKK